VASRAHFDLDAGRLVLKGPFWRKERSYALSDIHAVQFCFARSVEQTNTHWRTETMRKHLYQVNLIFAVDPSSRICLLDSENRVELLHIARAIAEFLSVPLYEFPRFGANQPATQAHHATRNAV